jgi:hypothetical protein
MTSEGFDWQTDDSVVVNWQPALAVYRNMMDSIVIRQERSELEDDDTIVIITPANAKAIADAILRVAREIGRDAGDVAGVRQITDQRPRHKANGTQIDAFESRAHA